MIVEQINVESITVREDNPRSSTDIKELAESISHSGLINPITVRELSKNEAPGECMYELIAGYRRLMAVKKNGSAAIDANVYAPETTDQTIQQTRAIENLQREDLTVFDQAAEIKKLLAAGWEVESIAEHMGKSVSWLRKRAAISDLSPKWVRAIKAGEKVSKWPAGHLELIGRMPTKTQERMFEDAGYDLDEDSPNIVHVRALIQRESMIIAGMPFKPQDLFLDPKAGSCLDCQKTSGWRPGLFDDLKAPKGKPSDTCLDGECFARKMNAHLKRKIEEMKKSGAQFVLVGSGDTYGKTVNKYTMDKAKKGDKKIILGLHVDAPEWGTVTKYKAPSSGMKVASGIGGEGKPTPLKDRKAKIEKRREALTCSALLRVVGKEGFSRIHKNDEGTLLRILAIFGTDERKEYSGETEWTRFANVESDTAQGMLWKSMIEVFKKRLRFVDPPPTKEMNRIAKFLNIDIGKLRGNAHEAIPDPKTWKMMNADGTPKKAKK